MTCSVDRPAGAVVRIHIPSRRKEIAKPRGEVLQLKDASGLLEAKNLDDLTAQLRERYPGDLYERTLHRERDLEAEERRAHAMDQLLDIIVQAAVVE